MVLIQQCRIKMQRNFLINNVYNFFFFNCLFNENNIKQNKYLKKHILFLDKTKRSFILEEQI